MASLTPTLYCSSCLKSPRPNPDRLKLRLLVTSFHLRAVGGTETYLRAVVPLLREHFDRVGVLTLDPNDEPADAAHLDGIQWLRPSSLVPADVLNTIAQWRPDVVYNHGLFAPEADVALAAGFPTIYFAHNYGGTCVSGTKCLSFPGRTPCDRVLGPGCLAMYLPRRCGGLNPLGAVRMYFRERRRQTMMRDCRQVLVASDHMRAELIANGISPEKVRLTPLFPFAVSPTQAPPTSRAQSGRILMMGRLTALKGWSELTAAIPLAERALGRRLTLVVAGDGPDRTKFEAEAKRHGVLAEFLGWLEPARRNAEMATADLITVPSVWPEPFGLIGIEAGCLGLPAVAFDVGGISDWLRPGFSGEMADLGRGSAAQALGEALARALTDSSHWHKLRIGAWETAKRFSPQAHLERLLPILRGAAA